MAALFNQQRAPSISADPRAPSPRPSTSSASRRKKPALDFEEALNNSETLYLRPDSVIGSLDGDSADLLDEDAPLPIEKLSFEDELRGGRTGPVGSHVAPVLLGTPTVGRIDQPSTPIVVPPTPTSGVDSSSKRDTLYSMTSSNGSALSGSSDQKPDGLLARVKTSSTSQVDLPIGALKSPERKLSGDGTPSDPVKPRTPMRQRSLVRSPGTASSPDLATLVKKAREARAALPSPSGNQTPTTPTTSSPSVPPKSLRRAPPPPFDVPPLPRPSSSVRDRSASQGGTLRGGSAPAQASAATQAQEWQKFTAQGGGVRSVGSGIAGGKQRSMTNEPDEGFKSMSKRAKGMFGRMFGQKDKSIPASSRKPVGYNASTDFFYPPAAVSSTTSNLTPSNSRLPRASIDSSQRQRTESTGTDDSQHLPHETIAFQLETVKAGESSSFSSQVRKRHDSDLDKPLPPIASSSGSPQPRRQQASANANRNSMHLRQPATGEADLMSSPKPNSGEWQDHVNDVFESIGTDEPHHGLGLPPSALAASLDHRRGLGKSSESEPTPALSDPPKVLSSPLVSQRTSSLPSKLPTLAAQVAAEQRVTSSPLKFERSRTTSGTTRTEFGVNGDPLAITPQTIRLISSNRPKSYIEQPSPVKPFETPVKAARPESASSWTRDPTTPRKDDGSDEPLETILTPEGQRELEEEKGRKLACEFLEGDETHIAKEKIAVYLGGTRPSNKAALRYYMQYFDWSGQRLDNAFRELCSKLHLKAETQEISRILEGFSERYYECNTGTIYGSAAIVYVVTGSFLLLNTDLHIAEISSHMSRSQFVRLTMETIHHSIQSDRVSTPDLIREDSSSSRGPTGSTQSLASGQASGSPSTLRNVRTRPDSALSNVTASPSIQTAAEGSVTSVSASGSSSDARVVSSGATSIASASQTRSWEAEMEAVLKDIYAAIKSNQILLPISNAAVNSRHSMVSLGSASPYSTMGRTRSMRNASGSSSDRVNVLKRGSVRGVQSLLSSSPYGANHDGRISPTPSVATSIGEGFNLQHFGAMGFASNLSHNVIKEHDDEARSIDSATSTSTADEMTDDELALLGAPWAKEGLLSRKLYWEAPNRRAKQKDWNKYFVVIQKGDLHLFVFGGGGSSSRGGAVGGGNWMANATPVDEINLSHAIASALPKPGYNAARPYCFSITLPAGEMSFYQAGTEDLVQEWVSTCNYWAARRSRPPLQGGVSNMEYGWNRVGDTDDRDETMSLMSNRSGRSRIGAVGTIGRRSFGNLDKVHINDWKPAQPALIPSQLDEEAQLESLQKYIKTLIVDLEAHKSLEEPMKRLFAPKSTNGAKALENWKAKFLYIHSEIIKFEIYASALKDAITLRLKKQGEHNLDKALRRAGREEDSDEDDAAVYNGGDVFSSGTGVLNEEDEPVTPSQRHFRGI